MNKERTWKFIRSQYNRPNVIMQELVDEEMNMIYLRKKYCNNGEFSVNFMAPDEGYVGNSKFYLSLILGIMF